MAAFVASAAFAAPSPLLLLRPTASPTASSSTCTPTPRRPRPHPCVVRRPPPLLVMSAADDERPLSPSPCSLPSHASPSSPTPFTQPLPLPLPLPSPSPSPSPSSPSPSPSLAERLSHTLTWRTVLYVCGAAALVYFARPLGAVLSAATSRAVDLGPGRAAVLLFFTNLVTVLLCFPGNMGLMIAASAVLPGTHAFAALFLSKVCAACAAYALARRLLPRAARARLFDRHPRLAKLGRSTTWRFVLLLRLSPLPAFLLNNALSVAGVPFQHYLAGSLLGMAPPVLNLVLIGNAARHLGGTAGTAGTTWLPTALRLAAVASMVAATVFATRAVTTAVEAQPLLDEADLDALEREDSTKLDPNHHHPAADAPALEHAHACVESTTTGAFAGTALPHGDDTCVPCDQQPRPCPSVDVV